VDERAAENDSAASRNSSLLRAALLKTDSEKQHRCWRPLLGNESTEKYRGADKSLARPGRKEATATEDFEFHISYL
jgi:hypothetical protein